MSVSLRTIRNAVNAFDVQSGAPYIPGMKSERLELRVPTEWLSRVDAWRRLQPAIPSRSEAVRALVDIGLQAVAQDTKLPEEHRPAPLDAGQDKPKG